MGTARQQVDAEVGDFVLKRADGLWSYQLAVVCDDARQGITHVVRGEDLINVTPKVLLIRDALGTPGELTFALFAAGIIGTGLLAVPVLAGSAAYGVSEAFGWPATLEALRALKPEFIVPGRGEAMKGNANVNKALDYTKLWVETLYRCGREAVAAGMDLKAAMAHTRKAMDPIFGHVFIYEHCLPFDVTRAFDEASGIKHPRIWTAERDMEMWKSLQA